MKVLLIDDDPDDTSLFREALFELDPNITCIIANTCENIQASLDMIGQVDIIFMDDHLYPIEGKVCLEQLARIVDHSKTKLVVYSGSLSPSDQLDLERIGADYVLIKATDYQMLKTSIREILNSQLNVIL